MNIFEPEKGMSVYQAAHAAIDDAARYGDGRVILRFNGLDVRVYDASLPDDIAEKYNLQAEIRRLKE